MKPVALTIAGSDPSGGAGLQADLKTFHQFGIYGTSVVTLLTVQNTLCVSAVEPLPAALVLRQLHAVLADIPPQAAKTGALGTAEIITVIADCAREFGFPLVVDPVMFSKHRAPLIDVQAREDLRGRLLPVAFLLTPNLPEASALTGAAVEDLAGMEQAARTIAGMGSRAVLIKGGHLSGDAVDVLYYQGRMRRFAARRVPTPNTHGTGCTFSAAITAGLAKGLALEPAIETAKLYITRAIEGNPGLGKGCGPVDHHAAI